MEKYWQTAILPRMAWMIGIDEAGYGPNLGPLAVAATVWLVEGSGVGGQGSGGGHASRGVGLLAPSVAGVDLYERLSSVVCAAPEDDRLAIADSKLLYKPGRGLRLLERGVLTALSAVAVDGDVTARWGELFAAWDTAALPWYDGYDCALPIDADEQEISDLAQRFTTACIFAGVQLVDVQTRLVFPRELNDLTDHYGTKGAALSHVSIGLLRDVLGTLLPDPRPLNPATSPSTNMVGGIGMPSCSSTIFPTTGSKRSTKAGPPVVTRGGLRKAR